MRLTNKFSVMGRKYDLAYGQANTWKRKLKNDKYELIENAIDKLGQLEDIEDRTNIDLITFFDALIGIWVKSTKGDVYYAGSPYLCFSENENRELELQFKVGDMWYKVKDYGKTYALTKEELE